MSGGMGSLIDQLGAASLECKEMIREAHRAERDLKTAIKEARAVYDEIGGDISRQIQEGVQTELDRLTAQTQTAMDGTSRKILGEFEKLIKPLLASLDDVRAHIDRTSRKVGMLP